MSEGARSMTGIALFAVLGLTGGIIVTCLTMAISFFKLSEKSY